MQLILQGHYFAFSQYHGFGLKRFMPKMSAEQFSVFGFNALQSIPHYLTLRKAFRRVDVSGGPRGALWCLFHLAALLAGFNPIS